MNLSNQSAAHQDLGSQTLDLTAGLGYGLFYQPIITSSSPSSQFDSLLSFFHRRYKRAKHCEMQS